MDRPLANANLMSAMVTEHGTFEVNYMLKNEYTILDHIVNASSKKK
jgi:hypothetical protein